MSVPDPVVPDISVIIVSWNSRELTLSCVESVLRHADGVPLELIVVDNASDDGTARAIRESVPHARLLVNTENLGFARASNQGMAAAQGSLLLLLNSDTAVKDSVIRRCVDWMREHPATGMLGCEVRTLENRRVHTANRSLSVSRSLLENLWLYKLIPPARRAKVLLDGYWEGDDTIEVDWLAGVVMVLRRELFEQSGGFDSSFFMYGEDSEWCIRLRREGHRIVYAPAAGVLWHVGAGSSERIWSEKERLRRGHVGGLQAYAILNGRSRAMLYRVAQLFGFTVRWSVYAAAGAIRPTPYLASQRRHYGWLRDFYLRPSRRY